MAAQDKLFDQFRDKEKGQADTEINDRAITRDFLKLFDRDTHWFRVWHEKQQQKVEFDKGVAKLSIIGTGIVGNPDIASRFFETLYKNGVNIRTISTSEIKMSTLIDKEAARDAMVKVHEAFELDR